MGLDKGFLIIKRSLHQWYYKFEGFNTVVIGFLWLFIFLWTSITLF